MAKNPTKKSSAATESVSSDQQRDDTATAPPVAETVSGPAGSQMPAGDHTQRESGDAAGEATAEPVKPQTEQEPAEVIVTEAAPLSSSVITPEAEASASGDTDPSQGDAAGGGANAVPTAGLPTQVVGDILSKVLGIDVRVERRSFHISKQVRLDGALIEPGGWRALTQKQHGVLFATRAVGDWEFGLEVRDEG